MNPEVRPLRAWPEAAAAVFVRRNRGLGLIHCGLLVADDDAEDRLAVDLRWHLQLSCTDELPRGSWVVPRTDPDALEDVATMARLVRERHEDGQIPYAFAIRDARLSRRGALHLGRSHGLTCASFVLVVFEAAKSSLINVATWDAAIDDARRGADAAAQERIAAHLELDGYGDQAELIRREVGCARVRAEEVAGASGSAPQPRSPGEAMEAGRRVARQLR